MSAEEVGKRLLGEVVEVGADEVSSDRTISTMMFRLQRGFSDKFHRS
jgi:hypothetical protein